jgi:ferrous iron transport protein B
VSVEAPTETREQIVAVVGNPNVGKSTLFNALTGLRQKVANYAGVTVDAREGSVDVEGERRRLIDLPGTYSMRPRAADEAIVQRVLTGDEESPSTILVVLDATNLRRNLFLLTEILDLGVPVVVALNMVDEARRAGLDVPTELLRAAAGVPVVETVATRGEGVNEILAALSHAAAPKRVWTFEDATDEERFAATAGATSWTQLKALVADDPSLDPKSIAARYSWINKTLLSDGFSPTARAKSDRIDSVLLHPILGPSVFLAVMGLLFQSIFTWAGPTMDAIEAAFGWLQAGAESALPSLIGVMATDLVSNGAIAGVGAVVIFLPQILILFLLLGLLEDTGYMARAAFLVDRPLRAVGLSGRSFIPLLSSFACAVPGIMATRTIPGRFERALAIFLAPLMTCSARLPVYTLLIGAFIPATTVAGVFNLQGLILFGLYLLGIVVSIAIAFLASRKKRRGRELPMVVELPPYRRPALKGVLLKLKIRGGDFLKRAGTVVFAVSVVLWFLMAFPRADVPVGSTAKEGASIQLRGSFAGRLGRTIEPVIKPLGYDWKMGVGLIASFAAREVFVSTMGVVYNMGAEVDEESQGLITALQNAKRDDGTKAYSLATVFSLLAFYVFALQCGATVAIVKRETASWRFALFQLLGYTALAYLAALCAYQGASALGYG